MSCSMTVFVYQAGWCACDSVLVPLGPAVYPFLNARLKVVEAGSNR